MNMQSKPVSAELPLRPASAEARGEEDASRFQVCTVYERLGADFPRTLCHFDVASHDLSPGAIQKALVNGREVPFQVSARRGAAGVFISLPKYGRATIEFVSREKPCASATNGKKRWSQSADGLLLRTANGAVCLPVPGETIFDPPADSLSVPAPIMQLVGQNGTRMGKAWIDTYERVVALTCEILEDGPLWTTVRIRYRFDNQSMFEFECTAADGEDFVRIREKTTCGPKSRWILMLDKASGMLPDGIDLADHTLFYQPRRLDYFADRLHARLYPWTQGTQIAALSEGIGVHDAKTDNYVAWFARTNDNWDGFKNTFVEFHERRLNPRNLRTRGGETAGDTFSWLPPDAKGTKTSDIGAFCAEAMLMEGSREYAILIGKRRDWHAPDPVPEHVLEWYKGPALTDEWNTVRSPLRRIIQFQGLLSLDIVKDWDLIGNIATAGALDHAHPAMQDNYGKTVAPLPTGTKANASVIATEMRNTLAVLATGYVMGRGPGGTNPVTLRVVFPLGVLLREMVARNVLPARLGDEAEGMPPLFERLAAMLLFLAHLLNRRSSYPGEYTMAPMCDPRSSEPTCLGMPNQNFFTDVYCAAGGVAMLFPEHPRVSDWLARANRMLALQLDTFSDPKSGVWEESHTYFHHVLRTLAPFALEQRGLPPSSPLAPVRVNWFRDERFIRLCRAVFHFVTPRDPNANGKRMMATLGDHRMELDRHTYNALAVGFAESEPTLAANLVWMSLENGWSGNPVVKPIPPRLESHEVSGLGAVLRGRASDAGGGESMVVLRAGNTWGHHNCDELELLYYAGGEPVIVEAGYGAPKTYSKVGPDGHSIMHPADFIPAFYLSRANRGLIDAFESDLPAGRQHMSASRPVAFMHPSAGILAPLPVRTYTQSRHVEWVEDMGDGASMLTIRDHHDGIYRQQLNFHTGGLGIERVAKGTYWIKGHARDSLLTTTPAVEFEIKPDACGFTHGMIAKLPEGVQTITTIIITSPGHIAPKRYT